MLDIVLASSSPYRKELLARLKLPFQVATPDIDESPLTNESFEEHVQRLSLAKAKEVGKTFPHAICIGSDEIAALDNEILGKPLTHQNAVIQLKKMSGKTICFYTGLALTIANTGYEDYRLAITKITVRELNDRMIENYLTKEQPYFSAGSFKSETLGSALITRFEGHDPTALIGLPLIDLTAMLEKAGMAVI